jgi:hypothetical protein
MTLRTIEPAQQTAARVAGFLYLAMMVTGLFAEFYARGPLIVPDDAAQTAANIAASDVLFRLGVVANLITFAGSIPLLLALYVLLEPVNRNVALLAVFWRLVETSVLAVVALNDFAALRLLSGAGYLRAVDTEQLQALARLFVGVQGDGYRIGLVFLGLGSTVFAYLLFTSRYVPRGLAAWGIFSSLVLVLVTLTIMVLPRLAPVVVPGYFGPIALFEVALGAWLLFKGVRAPVDPL